MRPASLRRLGLAVVGAALVAVAGYVLGQRLRGRGVDLAVGVDSPMLVVLLVWLALVWHELGHVMGGWLAGFRLQLFVAGPLRVDWRGGRHRWSFNRALGLWGGFAATSPNPQALPSGDALRRKMLLVVAGGPAASLLGGLIAAPLAIGGSVPPRLAFILLVGALTSIAFGLCTLVPVHLGGFVNDGRRLLDLWRDDAPGQRWIANVALAALASERRPRDWPQPLIETATRETQADLDGVLARWMRHAWHLDRGDIAEARDWLARALADVERLPSAARSIVEAAAADFYARIEPDPVRARRHLDACAPGFVSADALAMVDAAVRLAEGDVPGARAKLRQARRLLDEATGTSRDYLGETLDDLERRAAAS